MKKHMLLRSLAVIAAILMAGVWMLRGFDLIRAFEIPTSAMSPFLNPGDRIIVEAISSSSKDIKRGDVRTFTTKGIKGIYSEEPQMYIKRVVGLPGDELVIRDRKLWVNGKTQTEVFESPVQEYINPGATGAHSLAEPFEVPPDSYFVIGDNTPNSSDSRFWGPVPKENFMHLYRMHYRRAPNTPAAP